MKVLIVALVLLVVAPEVLAGGRWESKTITVFDHTSAAWDGIIEETVADLNAIMPKRAPLFVYQRMTPATPSTMPKHKRAIAIYDSDTDMACKLDGPQYSGRTCADVTRGIMSDVDVRLSNWWPGGRRNLMENLACHELMHAMTWVPDATVFSDQSCVQGYRVDPGPFDVSYARKVYKKH